MGSVERSIRNPASLSPRKTLWASQTVSMAREVSLFSSIGASELGFYLSPNVGESIFISPLFFFFLIASKRVGFLNIASKPSPDNPCRVTFGAFCLAVGTLAFCPLMGFPLNH